MRGPIRAIIRTAGKSFRGKGGQFRGSLLSWAAIVRRRTLPRATFICITGSAGKTTTVRLAGTILSSAGKCRIGTGTTPTQVSQSVLGLSPSTDFFIQEVHAPHCGVIAQYFPFLKPKIGIVTTIGGDHYKSYRHLEATAREKGLLMESLPKEGVAILNGDDPNVRGMAVRTRARVMIYGSCEDADVRATEISATWPDRLCLTVSHGEQTVRVETKLIGEHWVTSVLAAIAAGVACGIDLRSCAEAIKTAAPVFGRYSAHIRPDGAAFILDSEKASFWTIAKGLDFVRSARAPRKTMVFGSISDYPGKGSYRYRRVAREALTIADRVIFVGPQSTYVDKLREEAISDRLLTFQTAYQVSNYLSGHTLPGELIYIKAAVKPDHLERIALAQFDHVVCWRERCGKAKYCAICSNYELASPPPFGLTHSKSSPADPAKAVTSPFPPLS